MLPHFLFRVRERMTAKMIVEKFLPITFFSSGTTWTELIGVLISDNTPFPALPVRRVKRLIVEMYVATMKVGRVYVFFYEWTRQSGLSNSVLMNLCTAL